MFTKQSSILQNSSAALPQEAEEAEEARQAEEEARQAAIVEAERQRLLREAAAQLPRDCLPKGVFKARGQGGTEMERVLQEYQSGRSSCSALLKPYIR